MGRTTSHKRVESESEGESERAQDSTPAPSSDSETSSPSQRPRSFGSLPSWLNGTTTFPWTEIIFFIPSWVPSPIREHLVNRISKRNGKVTQSSKDADVVLAYYGLRESHSKGVQQIPRVKSGQAFIAYPDWLARVYFSDKALRPDSTKPLFLDKEGQSLLVAVPGLGDDSLRQRVMVALEKHGAIVVSEPNCNTCIVPDGHSFLRNPPDEWDGVTFHNPQWVFESIPKARPRAITMPSAAQKSPTQQHQHSSPRTAHKSSPHTPRDRVYVELPRRPSLAKRTAELPHQSRGRVLFTSSDRDYLARFVAFHRPTDSGRTARSLYETLNTRREDSIYHWATRHTPAAWHEHYRRTRQKKWSDGTILDHMIDRYVRRSVDFTLRTEKERAAGKKRSRDQDSSESPRKRRSRGQQSQRDEERDEEPDEDRDEEPDEEQEEEQEEEQDEDVELEPVQHEPHRESTGEIEERDQVSLDKSDALEVEGELLAASPEKQQ